MYSRYLRPIDRQICGPPFLRQGPQQVMPIVPGTVGHGGRGAFCDCDLWSVLVLWNTSQRRAAWTARSRIHLGPCGVCHPLLDRPSIWSTLRGAGCRQMV